MFNWGLSMSLIVQNNENTKTTRSCCVEKQAVKQWSEVVDFLVTNVNA